MIGNYIFVYGSISSIGGRQLYLNRKAKYLKEKGWNILIITADKKDMGVPDLSNFNILEIKEIDFPIFYFKKKRLIEIYDNILSNFKKFYDLNLPSIVESQDTNEIFWGELLAKKINAPNITYIIGEPQLKKLETIYKEIYLFKAERNECIGVSERTLNFLFEGIQEGNKIFNNYFNISFSCDELGESNQYFKEILNSINNKSTVISTVSRLEKAYVPVLIEAVISFAKKNNASLFTLIIVGDSYKRNFKKRYINKYKEIPDNLRIIFTGFLHPLPKELFKRTDIFIGMGTAVINAISQSCPTICVDPRSLKSGGILGIDLFNFGYGDIDNEITIEQELEKLFKNQELIELSSKMGRKLYVENYDNNIVLEKFLEFAIRKIKENDFNYFYNSIEEVLENVKILHKMRYYICRFFGIETLNMLSFLKWKLIDTFAYRRK